MKKVVPAWLSDASRLRDMGEYLEHMISFYRYIRHDDEGIGVQSGYKRHLGSGLKSLQSFAINPDDVKEASGLGVLLNVLHKSMRGMGHEIGRLFEPVFQKNDVSNSPSCPFAGLREKFNAIREGGKVELEKGIEIEADKNMGRLAFCGGALSVKFKARDDKEQSFLRENIGPAKPGFFELLGLCRKINDKAIEQKRVGYTAESELFDYRQIPGKLAEPEVVNAILGLHNAIMFYTAINKDDKCAVLVNDLRRFAGADVEFSAHGFVMQSAEDISALYYMVGFHKFEFPPSALLQEIESAGSIEAARVVLASEKSRACLQDIKNARWSIMDPKSQPAYLEAIELLERQIELAPKTSRRTSLLTSEVRRSDVARVG